MSNRSVMVVSALVLLAGGTAGYVYWDKIQTGSDADPSLSISPDENTTEPQLVLNDSPIQTALPKLIDSDAFVVDALISLLGNETLLEIIVDKKIIENIVTTIDNLPSMSIPKNVMPITMARDELLTTGTGNKLGISPNNAERYNPYMKVVDAIDATKLTQLYIRLYPLFQQSYEELGYPNKYFNDRLIYVIDDLLATPDIEEPVKLVQPLVVYKFANPDLEAKNIGQRTMLRIGNNNAQKVKVKLREIKQELQKHMHEKKAESTISKI